MTASHQNAKRNLLNDAEKGRAGVPVLDSRLLLGTRSDARLVVVARHVFLFWLCFTEFARDYFTCGRKTFKESHKSDEPLNVASGNSNTPPSSEFVSTHCIILFPTAWLSSNSLVHDHLPLAQD